MAQDRRGDALVYFCSAVDDLSGAVLHRHLDLESTDMTQTEALKLARKYAVGGLEFDVEGLERFVNDVRADEREACAKVCEKVAVDMFTQLGREHEQYMKATAEDCAMQIRARGQSQVCCEEYNTCVRPCTPRGRLYGQKEEREECAKVCEEVGVWPSLGPKHCADAIRARGQA